MRYKNVSFQNYFAVKVEIFNERKQRFIDDNRFARSLNWVDHCAANCVNGGVHV